MRYITIHDGNAPFPLQDLSVLIPDEDSRENILAKVNEALDELDNYKKDPQEARRNFFGDEE